MALIKINGTHGAQSFATAEDIQSVTNIDNLHDVSISGSLANGQYLVYNSSTNNWENVNTPAVVSVLDDLTDVDDSNKLDNYVLTWDAGAQLWEAQPNTQTVINNNADYSVVTGSSTPNQLEANNDFTWDGTNAVIEGTASSLTTPVLHLKTDNSNWFAGQLMCEDSNGKVFTQVGRIDTNRDLYQWNITLDPDNNDSPSGYFAGDFFVSFEKDYTNINNPRMIHRVFGAEDGYHINVFDGYNGGSPNPGPFSPAFPGYGYKPIVFNVETFEVNVKDSDTSVDTAIYIDDNNIECKRPVVFASYSISTNAPSNPPAGMQVFNTDTNTMWFYNGTSWGAV